MTLLVLRTFIETDLADGPLTVILAAADEDITTAVGADTSFIEERKGNGEVNLYLERPCGTMTSITETATDGTVTTLVASDYHLSSNALYVTRLNTGTNPASGWSQLTTFTYTPGDLNGRNRALVSLVQLELDYRYGKRTESIGDHSMTQQDYMEARSQIINTAMARWIA